MVLWLWEYRYEAGYESEDRYFALEITESFSEIYSKIIEKDILEFLFIETILTR
jgi:hypothetical protein